MAPPERFELPTNAFEAHYSDPLSYEGIVGYGGPHIKKRDREVMKGNLPKELTELFNNYEKNIANVDFQLDTPQMKKDVEKSTKKFLRGKK